MVDLISIINIFSLVVTSIFFLFLILWCGFMGYNLTKLILALRGKFND